MFSSFSFYGFELWLSCEGVVWVVLSTQRVRIELPSRSGHEISQSAKIVGSSGEGKQPSHFVDPS
jgi:hypothetical protein